MRSNRTKPVSHALKGSSMRYPTAQIQQAEQHHKGVSICQSHYYMHSRTENKPCTTPCSQHHKGARDYGAWA